MLNNFHVEHNIKGCFACFDHLLNCAVAVINFDAYLLCMCFGRFQISSLPARFRIGKARIMGACLAGSKPFQA